jgi:hypothetical protein
MDLTDIYRLLYPQEHNTTFLSAAHRIYSEIDHILEHKASLNKYKVVKIIPCIIPDCNGMKLELNNKRNYRKYSNT